MKQCHLFQNCLIVAQSFFERSPAGRAIVIIVYYFLFRHLTDLYRLALGNTTKFSKENLNMASTIMAAPTKIKATTRRRHPTNWREQGLAYLFLLPALLGFSLVVWYPM